MVKESSIIETGVDKLVEIIRAKRRISVQDASKMLGVGEVVVEEWADFLEEEGIISIEYRFATPYLVERKLTKQEIKSKEKEFHGEKEGFIRKAEVTLALLDREGETFQKFKANFDDLKKELGSDLKNVEGELRELEKFEDLKKGVDKQIIEHEKEFRNKIDVFEKEIEREEQKYLVIVDNLNREEEKLDKQRLETLSLREKEMNVRKKLAQFQEYISKINQAVKQEEAVLDDGETRIKNLKSMAERIKKDIQSKGGKGKMLMKEGTLHKKKIFEIQKAVLDKVVKNKDYITKQIEESRVSTKKFREFFNRKTEIENLLKTLEKEKDQLELELIKLIKKAKALHLASTSAGLKGHVKELETTFEDIKKKKGRFEQNMTKLSSLFK
ncbi:hypothetical protein GOV09_06245 [Candidatus Woesearchaeota archaeon]|nr:hypothetical protein [Candidatus Woesearchaeota archaeon]